ncbi:MAG: hypothetical protein MUC51_12470, partial [Anaerolineae bacterium]|nr:hypothetical protein [Anaerolineae bacterium]
MLTQASLSAAQDQPARVQRITGRLQAAETHAYLLNGLRAGDQLTVSMRATSGNLDPALGIVDTTMSLEEIGTRYQADLQRLLAANESVALALDELRNRYFLAFDDDGGVGYAAALAYVVPAPGDYVLIASSSLSALGRATSGDYELRIGLNAGESTGAVPTGAPIAERIPFPWGVSASVEEASGTLTAAAPVVSLKLVDIDAGATLTA